MLRHQHGRLQLPPHQKAYGGLLDEIAISDRGILELTLSRRRQLQDAVVFQSAIDVARRLALVLIGNALHVVAWDAKFAFRHPMLKSISCH